MNHPAGKQDDSHVIARSAAVLGPVVLLLTLRAAMLRSSTHQLYSGEAAGVGRLQWELSQGAFEWHGPMRFVLEHTYQYFAQGTAFLQAVAVLFAPVFGHSLLAQHAAAIALEALFVGLVALVLLRITTPGFAALGGVAVAVSPKFVATFALMPYGNHTEFLWVPMLMALFLVGRPAEERPWWVALPLGALLGAGYVLYRLDALACVALLAVLLASRARSRWVLAGLSAALAAATAAATFHPLALTPLGMSTEGLGSFPADGPRLDRVMETLGFAWERGLPAVRLGGSGLLHRLALLLAFAVAAWSWRPGQRGPRAELARFASLWGALALAAPIATGSGMPRYFIHAWGALTLCLLLLMAAERPAVRRGAASVVLVLSLVGLAEACTLVDRSTWDRPFPSHALWFVLEVDTLDGDELPYYQRLLDEGRGTSWIGRGSHHPSNECPRWPGTGPEPARPAEDHCAGWGEGELRGVLENVVRDAPSDGRDQALMDAGRGAWIRSNRDLSRVRIAVRGLDPSIVEWVVRGAQDEARRWEP